MASNSPFAQVQMKAYNSPFAKVQLDTRFMTFYDFDIDKLASIRNYCSVESYLERCKQDDMRKHVLVQTRISCQISRTKSTDTVYNQKKYRKIQSLKKNVNHIHNLAGVIQAHGKTVRFDIDGVVYHPGI